MRFLKRHSGPDLAEAPAPLDDAVVESLEDSLAEAGEVDLPEPGVEAAVHELVPSQIDLKTALQITKLEQAELNFDKRDLVTPGGSGLLRKFAGMDGALWVVGSKDRPYGWIALEVTTDKHNRPVGIVHGAVDPFNPFADTGREALLTELVDRAQEQDLTRLVCTVYADSPTDRFLLREGWRVSDAAQYVVRRLELVKTAERRMRIVEDTSAIYGHEYAIERVKHDARAAAQSAEVPAGYGGVGGVQTAAKTAPTAAPAGTGLGGGPGHAQRDVESAFELDSLDGSEDGAAPEGATLFKVVAVHKPTGQQVGFTEVLVYDDMPEFGLGGDLWVEPPHRGNRLGILMKAEIMKFVAQERSKVRVVQSRTDVNDTYMLAIHDRLGARGAGVRRDLERRL